MRIKITAGGIYGLNGEITVGSEFDVASEPKAWAGRYEILNEASAKAVPVTNPKKA